MVVNPNITIIAVFQKPIDSLRRFISAAQEAISGMFSPFEWACLGIVAAPFGDDSGSG
jgi:hypothetical protein